jgi:pimeloyl-ACP methyl ester carboxylesterase/class 3 adenylate cyclase
MLPRTHYARSGDVHVAYQVVGDGAFDLVLIPGFVSNVEVWWDDVAAARFFERLASFSRLILFDKRGTGLSDPVPGVPTLEQRMDDLRAVMDDVGSERAALMGISEGGPMAMLFAATYPDRTRALVLYGSFTNFVSDDDSGAYHPGKFAPLVKFIEKRWGEPATFDAMCPSLANDETARQHWARFERQSASPAAAVAVFRMDAEIDVRSILPSVRVPTLVVHRTGDRVCRVEAGRYLGKNIPEARYFELPGVDHVPWVGDSSSVLEPIHEFLTGTPGAPEADRVLATVLFTDIIGSTERAAELGDRRWRDLLENHHTVMRRELKRFQGREIDVAGDGFLASFDGPARAIRCASTIIQELRKLGIEIRAGLHTGECERAGQRLTGLAVHIGARVAQQAGAGEVLVSSTVKDLVAGSQIAFSERGAHQLKGVPGEWRLFAVES